MSILYYVLEVIHFFFYNWDHNIGQKHSKNVRVNFKFYLPLMQGFLIRKEGLMTCQHHHVDCNAPGLITIAVVL